jgi:RNA polymerase sigma-70 factor (ECF subfamily)
MGQSQSQSQSQLQPQSQSRGDWVSEVVDKYAGMVYRIAFAQMKNRVDADGVFQEVFLKLCKSAAAFETDEHIKAWLIKVTVNTSRKFFASSWNKKTVELPDELAYEEETPDVDVMPAVQSLPPKYRIVIHLFYFEDMPIAEIAKTLKLKAATVKSQLSRARELLKSKLEWRN